MVVIHCTVAVSTLNSRISCGNSTVMTVSVRMPMKASDPTATIAPISFIGMRSSIATPPAMFVVSRVFTTLLLLNYQLPL